MAPTAYMAWCAVHGRWSTMRGARYVSQLTRTWANLSAPNRIGATVKPMRRSQNAWNAGLSQRGRATSADAISAVVVGRERVVAIACLLLYRIVPLTLDA